jgi:ABC-type uncharacterized transport system substrate-binding protein
MASGWKGIGFGLLLVVLCGIILLASDWHRRRPAGSDKPAVALFIFSDREILESSAQGCLDGLAARGWRPGREFALRRYSAANDLTLANSIARTIAGGDSRLVITFSTPALQVMAAANRERRMPHLFGAVTDPFQSGVGLSRARPEERPPWLGGIGTFQPVRELFRLVRQVRPELKRVGVVWCTAETCSEACTVLARDECARLGMDLVEMPVMTSSEITDAVRALLARQVEAIWIGGDNIVEQAAPSVIELALQAGIPVFANAPVHAENGALLGLGADYYQVGRTVGDLAADVLEGRSPGAIPVDNVVPQQLAVNTAILSRLRPAWTVPPEVLASASRIIGEPDSARSGPTSAAAPAGPLRRIGVMYYGPDPMIDRGLEGFRAGLAEAGLVEGRNLALEVRHANSDSSVIPLLVRRLDEAGLDLLTPMTTPCLMAALAGVRRTPVVFTLVYDPVAAGAGADATNHLAGVTGVSSFPPLADTMDLLRDLLPEARRVGTLYNPAEANSSRAVALGRELLRARGFELKAVTVASSAELHPAAQALVAWGAEALWITGDNTAVSGFAAIHAAVRDARVPLVCNDLDMVEQGATAAVGFNPWHSGHAAAALAARVLQGESPGAIPFQEVSVKQVAWNESELRRLNLAVPARWKSDQPAAGAAAPGRTP